MSWNMGLRVVASTAVLCAAIAAAEAQVCQLRSENATGTAVCIGTNDAQRFAVFLTAGHCCEGVSTIDVAPDGVWRRARVLGFDSNGPGRDLAILRVDGYCPAKTYVLADQSPPIGATVTFAGFARGGRLQHSKAVIVSHQKGWSKLNEASIGGESGGPVLNGPRVVGIITHCNAQHEALYTNIETIRATLAAWGKAPSDQKTGIGIGVGVGGYCTPYGCYPARPAMPAMPEERPQDPGWPGFASRPPADAMPPSNPAKPVDPFVAAPPAAAPDAATNEALTKIVDRLEAMQKRLDAQAAIVGPPGPAGPRGPAGVAGPMGLPGMDGRDADPSAVDEIKRRLVKLEAVEVPIQIIDEKGNVLEEDRVPLGQPIRLKLVPRSN